MISYAQNFEDVILERAFKGQATGFYIDVGAWEPAVDSVTKHFYDNGWRGINIEPLLVYHTKLEQQRIGDINLNIALLDKPGTAPLYTVPGTGLSTFDSNYADQHQKLGFEILEQPVPIKTLEAIRSGPANLHSAISENSRYNARPEAVWQQEVSDGEKQGIGWA